MIHEIMMIWYQDTDHWSGPLPCRSGWRWSPCLAWRTWWCRWRRRAGGWGGGRWPDPAGLGRTVGKLGTWQMMMIIINIIMIIIMMMIIFNSSIIGMIIESSKRSSQYSLASDTKEAVGTERVGVGSFCEESRDNIFS